MKILIINGPNLNMLGIRDPSKYGKLTLGEINIQLQKRANKLNCQLMFFQSNHEGDLVDFLQKEAKNAAGILINPGALTHYGYSLRDCLADTKLPIAEIHLSDINNREAFRKFDVLEDVVITKVLGLKEKSYFLGLKKLVLHIRKRVKKL